MKVRVKESIKERPNNFNGRGHMDYMLEFPRPILEVVHKDKYVYEVKCLKYVNQVWILNNEDCEIVEDSEPQVLPIQLQEELTEHIIIHVGSGVKKITLQELKQMLDKIPKSEGKK